MGEVIVMILLVVFGIEDVRKKSFSLPMLVVAFGFAFLFRLFLLGEWKVGVAGVGSGILVWLISKISQGQIGRGDGLLLMVTGMLLGFWENNYFVEELKCQM